LNASRLMLVTAVPMTKEVSPEFSKAFCPMLPVQLIVAVVRLAQPLNASRLMLVTAVPMTKEVSPEFSKAFCPMLPAQLMNALVTPEFPLNALLLMPLQPLEVRVRRPLVMNWALLLLVTCTAACALLTCSLCSCAMMKSFMKKLLIVTASGLAGRGFPRLG
jgi:hypothetical protein